MFQYSLASDEEPFTIPEETQYKILSDNANTF